MASLVSPAPFAESHSPDPLRQAAPPLTSGPAARAAAELNSRQQAQQRTEFIPANLVVRLDPDAGRFVQTLTDAVTRETLLRFPSEEQLAYSRAVTAYLRAQVES